MMKDEEIIGEKWGKLTAESFEYRMHGHRYFRFMCECGNEITSPISAVKNGHIKTCGKCRGSHKMSHTKIYKIWAGIKSRCYQPSCSIYYKYGGRGITMCDEWRNSPENFFKWAFENGYKEGLTIDRINSDKGYSPNNCRWATYQEQNSHLKMLKTNKSGYRGISWDKESKKWLCVISINNKSHRIGAYKTQLEAVAARNKFIDDNNLIYHQKNTYVGELSYGY